MRAAPEKVFVATTFRRTRRLAFGKRGTAGVRGQRMGRAGVYPSPDQTVGAPLALDWRHSSRAPLSEAPIPRGRKQWDGFSERIVLFGEVYALERKMPFAGVIK